ncbi:MAG: PD-(D/E)XK nuclease family protein [Candidatus Berkelbacteria bacterium]|nr:PD-(D/E)XK nuclease family protein [Candidatus Berkelbacteria bacterium]MCR4308040.1 PD-(D/E)XK nuclease family protein [Candidatus Berkelbacteria bacterium]
MDSILKNRFDKYRTDGTFPPEMLELEHLGIKPFSDIESLNNWRENSSALQIMDEKVGYVLSGKIDDVLVESNGRLIPADYKSSGNAPAEDKQKYYADQLAAYGLMFSKAGHEVSDRAYLLHYFVKDKTDGAIDVTFDSHLDLVPINLKAIEKKLADMVGLLNFPYPGDNPECQKCAYYSGRSEAVS